MNTNQDTTLTNQDAFKKWRESPEGIKANSWSCTFSYTASENFNAGFEAATQASESEINSLKERVAELQIMYRGAKRLLKFNTEKNPLLIEIAELTASNNQLRGLCEKIYADLQRGNACRDTMDNLRLALSSTPAQSLAEHDNEVIERCVQIVAKYANLQPIAEEICELKGKYD